MKNFSDHRLFQFDSELNQKLFSSLLALKLAPYLPHLIHATVLRFSHNIFYIILVIETICVLEVKEAELSY